LEEAKREPALPLRTLHDFLFELNDEWDRFRRGSMWSMVTTILLFVLFIPRYFMITLRTPNRLDTMIALGIIVALCYGLYLSYNQHSFYSRWEKRLGLLLHLEERILEGE
jgi:hypothetical protein